jgi:hypothetical protein
MNSSLNIPRCQQASFSKHFKRLFQNTYWGGHSPFDEEEEKQLCINRDLMAEQYSLKKFYRYNDDFPKKYREKMIVADITTVWEKMCAETFDGRISYYSKKDAKRRWNEWLDNYSNFMKHKDHPEYYTDSDKNIVSVFSIYIRDDNTEEIELIEKCGYERIAPIYDLSQMTFIKVIYKR